ncbi:MAG: hypothetical protein KBA26_10300 [Candidatus Delongbacteria bacterium]|nr:hypothetical protein [Candidatus Delongbacteria bacterium]
MQNKSPVIRNEFGTFEGVFTPTILTIFGAIMFMRMGFVVGYAGVMTALVILVLAKSVTLLTGLSISAIATNTSVKGGGAYFIISRVLGPKFGGTIGISLYLAQALSIPLHILGFTEAMISIYPEWSVHYFRINLITTTILFIISFIGAAWAIRTQFVIMGCLLLSIVSFVLGMGANFSPEVFASNLTHHFDSDYGFWGVFAIFFPAASGIMAGVNMSGDLKDPSHSIPRGLLSAILAAFVVYALEIILLGGVADSGHLIKGSFGVLLTNSWMGIKALIILGVFAAALSTALGLFVSAPRILQALSRDDIIRFLSPFAQGSRKGDEPRNAIVLSMILSLMVVFFAGNNASGTALNSVASFVTIFFLYAYGIVNLAGFVESFGANPSFRPRFKLLHWSLALLGGIACLIFSIMIDYLSSLGVIVMISLLFFYFNNKELDVSFGDARRGFLYRHIRDNLLKLSRLPIHVKNWRPTLLIFSKNPILQPNLVQAGVMIAGKKGLISTVSFIEESDSDTGIRHRREFREEICQWLNQNRYEIFPEVVFAGSNPEALTVFLQSYSIGPIRPNLLLMGWPSNLQFSGSFFTIPPVALHLGLSNIFFIDHGSSSKEAKKRIDIWWKGEKNGSLMLIIAHLIIQHPDWRHCRIRVLRLITPQDSMAKAEDALKKLIYAARINAEIHIAASWLDFREVLHTESHDASLIILGFSLSHDTIPHFYATFDQMTAALPDCLLVQSTGEANLLE